MTRYRRRSARVILVDAEQRVLLFRHVGSRGPTWITPGGGRNRWETARRAAARELREETGLGVPPRRLGPLVAYTTGLSSRGLAPGLVRNDYFFHRVAAHTVDTSRFTEYERTAMTEHRWWELDALASTTDRVHPSSLHALLLRLLAGEPVRNLLLPWDR